MRFKPCIASTENLNLDALASEVDLLTFKVENILLRGCYPHIDR